jgi:signal peptidase I
METLLLALFMVLLVRIIVQNFHVEGQSMEPTLHDQEYILVDKAVYLFQPPQRGDIVVFQYPRNPRERYVKRIIAVPGDIVSVIDSQIIVDGITLREPYVNKTDNYNPFPSFKKRIVAPDEYFVLGDNRGNSSDSRDWGLVPRHYIIGRAAVVYWPFNANNLGLLPDTANIFSAIHN